MTAVDPPRHPLNHPVLHALIVGVTVAAWGVALVGAFLLARMVAARQ